MVTAANLSLVRVHVEMTFVKEVAHFRLASVTK